MTDPMHRLQRKEPRKASDVMQRDTDALRDE
jgi:hypothetical protein